MKLKRIYVEITNTCNLSCSFCHETCRDKKFITVSQFEDVLKKIKPHTNYINLHVLGEPLLHPQIDLILNLCEKYDINARITTNASLIKFAFTKLVNKPKLRQINYSLHSISEQNKNYKEVLDPILAFIKQSDSHLIHCMRFWNADSKSKFLNEQIFRYLISYFKLDIVDFNIENHNNLKLQNNVYLQIDKQFTWPDLNNDFIKSNGRCLALKNNVGILVDGSVVPCCLDAEGAITLGNIYTSNLEEILTTPRALEMKQGFQNHVLTEKLCQTCGFINRLN